MKNMKIMFSLVTATALMVGCGSSGSSSTPTTSSPQSDTKGTVIDDYISGATVCADVDRNSILNRAKDKPCTKTNKFGQFNLGTGVSNLPLVMAGGTDVGTNTLFTGTLTAPVGSTVVNPLTTLIQAVVASDKGFTVASAESLVKTQLGLGDVNESLTSYDPLAKLSTGTPTERNEAKQVFARQSAVQVVLTSVAKTIASTVADKNETHVTKDVATQMAALMTDNNTTLDINATNVVSSIMTGAITEANITDTTALANLKTIVAATAAQIATASSHVISTIENINTSSSTDKNTTLITIREAAVKVATVVATNTDNIATALENNNTTTLANDINQTTQNFDTNISHVTVRTNLTEVATDTTIPTEVIKLPDYTGSTGQ